MAKRDEAREMLVMARKDLKAIRNMGDPAKFDDEIYGFHVQQAIEKALKGWLSFRRRRYPLTHSLRGLLALLEEDGCDVTAFLPLVRYNAFAVQFRCEEAIPVDQPLDRQAALADATATIEHVEKVIAR